jgi:hypothetical protein
MVEAGERETLRHMTLTLVARLAAQIRVGSPCTVTLVLSGQLGKQDSAVTAARKEKWSSVRPRGPGVDRGTLTDGHERIHVRRQDAVTESAVVPGARRGDIEIVNSRHQAGESGAAAHLELIDMYLVVAAVLVELEMMMTHVTAIETAIGNEIEIAIETGIGMPTAAEAEDTMTAPKLWKSIATSQAPVLDQMIPTGREGVSGAVVAIEIEIEIGAREVEIVIARGTGSGGIGVEIVSERGRKIRTRTRPKKPRVAGARA